jgi:hypothetical protein
VDSDSVQCPYCLKHVQVRQDGKMAKHTITTRLHRGGKPCVASELTLDEARVKRAAGEKPDAGDVEPQDIF